MGKYSSNALRLALEVQRKYDVPASVTLSAYAVESGRGTSSLAVNHNNYFGITGTGTAGSVQSGGRKWATYNSMAESFDAFGKLLSNDRYSKLTENATDLESYIRAYADTYCPPSDNNGESYADKLLSVIESDNLTVYDSKTYQEKIDGVLDDLEMDSNGNLSIQGAEVSRLETVAQKVLIAVVCLLLMVGMFYFIMKSFDVSIPSLKGGGVK